MGSCRLLEAWDTAKTDALKEARPGKSKRGSSVRLQLAQERAAAQDVEDEKNVRNEEACYLPTVLLLCKAGYLAQCFLSMMRVTHK